MMGNIFPFSIFKSKLKKDRYDILEINP